MIKCTILIPTTHNGGTPISLNDISPLLAEILDVAGGYTTEGQVFGKYVMADGSECIDRCLKLWVVCEAGKLPALRDIAATVAHDLKQETIYFEWKEVNVEFIKPVQNGE